MSIDKQIDNLYFKPFPTKAIEIEKIARTGSIIVALSKSGTLYTTSHDLMRKVCWAPGRNSFFDDVAVTLRKLGVITPAQVKAHKDWCVKVGDRRGARWRYKNVVRDFRNAGIKLSQEQRDYLRADAGLDPSTNDDDAKDLL